MTKNIPPEDLASLDPPPRGQKHLGRPGVFRDLIVRIAGEGGEGIISTGDMITQACARAGLDVYTFKTFPAEIKGGYAMYQVRASRLKVHNQGDTFDVLCAFNGEAFDLNRALLTPGTVLVYDSPGDFTPEIPIGVTAYPVPMTATAKEMHNPRAKNMVALGALSTLFSIPASSIREVIAAKFKRKGEIVVQGNLAAFERGRALAEALTKADPYAVEAADAPADRIIM